MGLLLWTFGRAGRSNLTAILAVLPAILFISMCRHDAFVAKVANCQEVGPRVRNFIPVAEMIPHMGNVLSPALVGTSVLKIATTEHAKSIFGWPTRSEMAEDVLVVCFECDAWIFVAARTQNGLEDARYAARLKTTSVWFELAVARLRIRWQAPTKTDASVRGHGVLARGLGGVVGTMSCFAVRCHTY